jgi:hypothetical protein
MAVDRRHSCASCTVYLGFECFGRRPLRSTFDLLGQHQMIVRVFASVFFARCFNGFGQAEVGHFSRVVVGNENVACGDVSMHNVMFFEIGQTFACITKHERRTSSVEQLARVTATRRDA